MRTGNPIFERLDIDTETILDLPFIVKRCRYLSAFIASEADSDTMTLKAQLQRVKLALAWANLANALTGKRKR